MIIIIQGDVNHVDMTVEYFDPTHFIPLCCASIFVFMLLLLSLFRGYVRIIAGASFFFFCSYLMWRVYGLIHVFLLGMIILFSMFLFDTEVKCGYFGSIKPHEPNQ